MTKQTKDFIEALGQSNPLGCKDPSKVLKFTPNNTRESGSDFDVDKYIKIMEDQPMQVVNSEPTLQESSSDYENKMQVKLKDSIETFCDSLQNDQDYYRSFKDNIAMSFKDVVNYNSRSEEDGGETLSVMTKYHVHLVANKAADNFLQQLISEINHKRKKYNIATITLKEHCLRDGKYFTTFKGKEMCLDKSPTYKVTYKYFADLDDMLTTSDIKTLTIGLYE